MDSRKPEVIAIFLLAAAVLVGTGAMQIVTKAQENSIKIECIKTGKSLISGSRVELAK